MELTFEYITSSDRDIILNENKENYLIAEKNIREGNFLVFTTIKPIVVELNELKNKSNMLEQQLQITQEVIDFLLMGGM